MPEATRQALPLSLAVKLTTGLLLLAWPLLIWWGLTYGHLNAVLLGAALVLSLRLYLTRQQSTPMRSLIQLTAVIGVVICVASYLMRGHHLLLFYPVAVNLIMLLAFGGSLWSHMPLVERLARLQHPDLPPEGVRYTRQVTKVWCGFFIVNGAIAFYTAVVADISLWTLWNGCLSYLLMGLLMTSEWLIRRRLIRKSAP